MDNRRAQMSRSSDDESAKRDIASCHAPVELPEPDLDKSIPERFEKIVRLYPNCLAVKIGDQSVTYDELNRYANRIRYGAKL